MLKEIFHDNLKLSNFTRTDWVAKVVFLIQILLSNFGRPLQSLL